MRIPESPFSRYSGLAAFLLGIAGLGILCAPSNSQARNVAASGEASLVTVVHGINAISVAASRLAAAQEAVQAAPPATATAPKPVELPEGDGKPIAMEYCQDCHRLTNLTKAHKNLDDWKDTLQLMIDRGSRLPAEKIDALAQYLATNFPAKDATAAAASAAPAPATPSTDAAAPSTPAPAKAVVELPDGDGKAIATENCQVCHKLTNLTKAHKSLDDWKDTVQLMIDRGANVPADKIDTLVQYLAKNFGPKEAPAPASSAAPPSSAAQ